MISLYKGARVTIYTADHRRMPFRAITDVIDGHDFPVVWVCSEGEWDAANRESREPRGLPWPAEAVEIGENTKNAR